VPGWIHVVPEDLQVSAAKVDAHADEMYLRHTAANGRVEAAQVGLPAASAAAMGTALAKWQADTAAIFSRMVDHGAALRAGAAGYQQTDEDSAGEIETAGETVTNLDLGL
jgi:uncharacterized protein YukE